MNQLRTCGNQLANNYTNIQYDGFKSTKEVLKDFRAGHENKLKNQLSWQGSFFSSVTKFTYILLQFVTSTTPFRPVIT